MIHLSPAPSPGRLCGLQPTAGDSWGFLGDSGSDGVIVLGRQEKTPIGHMGPPLRM